MCSGQQGGSILVYATALAFGLAVRVDPVVAGLFILAALALLAAAVVAASRPHTETEVVVAISSEMQQALTEWRGLQADAVNKRKAAEVADRAASTAEQALAMATKRVAELCPVVSLASTQRGERFVRLPNNGEIIRLRSVPGKDAATPGTVAVDLVEIET